MKRSWSRKSRQTLGTLTDRVSRYKVGDSFVHISVSDAQEMLSTSIERTEEAVSQLEDKLQELRDEMKGLKAQLYARFGKSINLD